MPHARRSTGAARLSVAVTGALGMLLLAPSAHAQGEGKKVLIYTGTTGFRHTDAINNGRPVIQRALEDVGYTVAWEDCDGNGGGANNCDGLDANSYVFSDVVVGRREPARPAPRRGPEGGPDPLRPGRRRRRRGPQLHGHGRRPLGLGLVGRQP